MNPVETPGAGGTIEIPGDGSIVLTGENPVGTEAPANSEEPATSEEPAESEEPATGNRIYFKGNGGKLRSYANSDWGTPDYYVAGTEINIATVLDGKTFVHDLSKDYSTAYRFTGWNTSADGNGTAYANTDSFIMPDGPVTLYAQWEAYEWIYWNVRLGEGGDYISYAFGNVQSFKAYCCDTGNVYGVVPGAYYGPIVAVPKDGYTFIGWYYGDQLVSDGSATLKAAELPALSKETSGAVVEARFTSDLVITYTDGINGAAFANQVYFVKKGEATPTFEGTPERKNCTFLGWSPEVAELATESVTYVAQWDIAEPKEPKSKNKNVPDEMLKFHCITVEDHPDATYKWGASTSFVKYVNNSMKWDEDRGAWVARATINVAMHLSSYYNKTYKDVTHFCTDESGNNIKSYSINLTWNPETGKWEIDGGPVVLNVWCYTEPAAPVADKLGSYTIRVIDSDNAKSWIKYTGKTLLAGTYVLSDKVKKADGTYWATLTITDLQAYADAFNTKYNADSSKNAYIVDEEKTTSTFVFDLKYTGSTKEYKQDGSGWTVQHINTTEKNNGRTLYVFSPYIITYTDGVEGEEIFADQVYKVKANVETPAYVGTPTREGHLFDGWKPAVAEKVSGDATYEAQWVKAPVIVTYTDGVGGEAFEDQVFEMFYGDAVPDFDGTPARAGYTFAGWDVEAPETLTEDITFTAQWKVINDSDVPRTGDDDRILRPAVLAGAMLMLCAGAAMVVVNKRKQEN